MYVHAALDRMIETQGWLCPIQADKRVDGAFYSPAKDIVVLPMKEQFNIGNTPEEVYRGGMEFYSTMLHEMSHSTMTPERLNREMGGRFGDPKYAKEELVAELTAAMISHSMGFDSKVTDNSAAYLDSWIGVLKQEPKFIVSVMADVNKASDLFGPGGQAAAGSQRTALPDEERPVCPVGRRRRGSVQECGHREDKEWRLRYPCLLRRCGTGFEEGVERYSQDLLPADGLQGQGCLPEHDGAQDLRTGDSQPQTHADRGCQVKHLIPCRIFKSMNHD